MTFFFSRIRFLDCLIEIENRVRPSYDPWSTFSLFSFLFDLLYFISTFFDFFAFVFYFSQAQMNPLNVHINNPIATETTKMNSNSAYSNSNLTDSGSTHLTSSVYSGWNTSTCSTHSICSTKFRWSTGSSFSPKYILLEHLNFSRSQISSYFSFLRLVFCWLLSRSLKNSIASCFSSSDLYSLRLLDINFLLGHSQMNPFSIQIPTPIANNTITNTTTKLLKMTNSFIILNYLALVWYVKLRLLVWKSVFTSSESSLIVSVVKASL